MEQKIRKHIIFHGDVQGVGFRYRAYYAAELYGVTGYVRNLPNGTVEMEAECFEDDINKMIIAIKRSNYIDITDLDITDIPIENDNRFVID